MRTLLHTWLQLFRAPNLFTVPGDPIAGFLIANYGIPTPELFWAIGASLCFYAAGLLDNDLADLAEDRRERPKRPLPSGAARRGSVIAMTLLLSALGLGFCAALGSRSFYLGAGILAAVGCYNHGLKHIPILGALNMGLCRSLSLLLGASAAPAQAIGNEAIAAAALIGLYIAAITNLARFETRSSSPVWARWAPVGTLAILPLAVFNWPKMGTGAGAHLGAWAMPILLVLALIASVGIVRRLEHAPIPPAIGQLIRLLLLIQAAFSAHSGLFGLFFAIILIALWPVSRAVSRRFYAS